MSTTTNAGKCNCCGKDVPTRDDDDDCIDCRYTSLQHDLYAGEVIERVLGNAIDGALMYLAPSDVHQMVDDAVKRTGCDGATPLAVVLERSRNVNEARFARVGGAA
jgi:hypothetical protein